MNYKFTNSRKIFLSNFLSRRRMQVAQPCRSNVLEETKHDFSKSKRFIGKKKFCTKGLYTCYFPSVTKSEILTKPTNCFAQNEAIRLILSFLGKKLSRFRKRGRMQVGQPWFFWHPRTDNFLFDFG